MTKGTLIALAALGLVALAACEENPARDYGRALTGSLEKADNAADIANLEAMKKSIAAHYAANGAYPENLDEIAQAMGLDAGRYDYDHATGRVALR